MDIPDISHHKNQTIELRPGFELIISDAYVAHDTRVHFASQKDVCELCFILSGNMKGWIDGLKEDINLGSNISSLWLTPRLDACTDYFPGANVRYVCVKINRSMLIDIAGDFLTRAPKNFYLTLQNRQDDLYYRSCKMTIPMQAAIQQVYQCAYHGAMKKVFLEGKALELISHSLTCHFGNAPEKNNPLPAWEKQKIEQARDTLLAHIDNPLTLAQLAKTVGINQTKLTRGFRIMFGTSVFGYLTNCRLAKARMLLEKNSMSITEIAYCLGYSSPSHFTRIFTKYNGVNPRDYLLGFKYQ